MTSLLGVAASVEGNEQKKPEKIIRTTHEMN
jgi:hypothetical protein